METKTVKRSKAIISYNSGVAYINKVGGKNKNHLTYACDKTIKSKSWEDFIKIHNEKSNEMQEKANQEIMDFKIDNASLDAEKNVLVDDKGDFKFTPDALKKVNKTVVRINKELSVTLGKFLDEEIELEVHVCKNIPEIATDILESLSFFLPESVEKNEDLIIDKEEEK